MALNPRPIQLPGHLVLFIRVVVIVITGQDEPSRRLHTLATPLHILRHMRSNVPPVPLKPLELPGGAKVV